MPDTKHNPPAGENWEPVQGWPLWSRRLLPDGSGWIWSLNLQQGGPHFPAIVFVPNVMNNSNNPDMGQVMAALTRIEQGIIAMSGTVNNMQTQLDADAAADAQILDAVEAMHTEVDSFIGGLPAMIQSAIDAAQLTPEQAAQFADLRTKLQAGADSLKAQADQLKAAANPEPAPAPAPEPTP